MARTLSRVKLDALWKAYIEDQHPYVVARKIGVHYTTAMRYIKRGDPKNGIEAFEARFKKIQEQADFDLAKEQSEDMKKVRTIVNASFQDLFRLDKNNRIIGLKQAVTMGEIEKMIRLKYFLGGEPDSRSEIKVKGEIDRVIQAVIATVTKFVKDQPTRTKIANELDRLLNREGDSGRAEGAGLLH